MVAGVVVMVVVAVTVVATAVVTVVVTLVVAVVVAVAVELVVVLVVVMVAVVGAITIINLEQMEGLASCICSAGKAFLPGGAWMPLRVTAVTARPAWGSGAQSPAVLDTVPAQGLGRPAAPSMCVGKVAPGAASHPVPGSAGASLSCQKRPSLPVRKIGLRCRTACFFPGGRGWRARALSSQENCVECSMGITCIKSPSLQF